MTPTDLLREEQKVKERLHLSLLWRELVAERFVVVVQEFDDIIDHALSNGSRHIVQRAFMGPVSEK